MVWPIGALKRSVPFSGGVPGFPWQIMPVHVSAAMMAGASQYIGVPPVVDVVAGGGSLEQPKPMNAVRERRV